ncbi:unnamed protein product [Ilex paraguariensis]|uniref:Uncharacterized protein n=1 Tax=Ilex paraguariensis TaxID=185542 RepID=A0ABC8RJ59_9AQUA
MERATSKKGAGPARPFFGNDSLLFLGANASEARVVKNILQIYETVSGQKINNEKSTMVCNCNTPEYKALEIQGILGVQLVE